MPAVTSTIGIIYPPPEVRSIVDKTATFVARNGPEFEDKIRQNEISNAKFNFLNSADPYHAYYRHKLKEIQEGKSGELAPPQPTVQQPQQQQLQANLQKLSIKTKDTQSKLIEQMLVLKDPPAELEYILDAPSVSVLDVDVIKLTAQFVARNGRPFLTNLMNKEQRNPMFDFLKPQHSYFNYFTRLVDQYTKILLPPRDLVDKMKSELENPFSIVKDVLYRVEWEKAQQRERAKESEMAEKERIAYAQIDWHDFVVVETVDYQPNEIGNFPPPTNPAEVGARVIAQARIETGEGANLYDINGRLLIEKIIEEESRVVDIFSSQTSEEIRLAPAVNDKNVDQIAMDEDSDQEESKSSKGSGEAKKKPELPLPPNPDNVIIRKDYNPKAKTQPKSSAETYFKSPLTGELIPASMMSEHMRISMLDPKWLEQKQKERKDREEQEEVLASGMNIERNLKNMAEYRSDLFGKGAEEAIIGRKLGEEEKKTDESVTWDGHNSTSDLASKRALTGITIEDQIKAIHQSQGMIEDESLSNIGPKPVVITAPASINKPSVQVLVSQKGPSKPMEPPRPPPVILAPPPMPQPLPPQLVEEEPSAKRIKTAEDLLVPESEWLARYAGWGQIKFYIQAPVVPEKPEWNLNGQIIPLVMDLTEPVSNIKNKLTELLTIPGAKQKLQYETIFIKDTNTLAYYNIAPESSVQLQLKERGGRKK